MGRSGSALGDDEAAADGCVEEFMGSSTGTKVRVEPSLGPALERVIDLSRRVVVDQIELLQVESQDWLVGAARRAALVSLGAMSLLVAWIVLLAAGVVALDGYLPLGVRLVLAAGVEVLVGVALLCWGMLRGRGAR